MKGNWSENVCRFSDYTINRFKSTKCMHGVNPTHVSRQRSKQILVVAQSKQYDGSRISRILSAVLENSMVDREEIEATKSVTLLFVSENGEMRRRTAHLEIISADQDAITEGYRSPV